MKKISKHWIILAVCCGLSASSIGISINCSGIFYTPVSESLGILRGSFAMHMTIFSMVTALASFFIPTLMKKVPYKLLLTVSSIVAVITTALMGFVDNLLMFYVLGALRGASTALFASVPLTMIINNWFVEKHGLATSLVFSFSGVAGTLFSPILSSCIEKYGWQTSYVIMGMLILFLTLPSIIYPFHIDPLKESLLPYGGKKQEQKVETSQAKFNFVSAPFIAFFVFGLLSACLTSVTQHFPGYAASLGFSASIGALLLSAGMVGNISFKLLIGVLSDMLGTVKAVIIMLVAVLTGTLLLMFSKVEILLILGAFLFGASYAVGAVGLPLLTKYFFKVENYSKVYPSVSFASNLGAALSLSLVGYIYDFFGSYLYAFMAALAMLGMCFVAIKYILKSRNI